MNDSERYHVLLFIWGFIWQILPEHLVRTRLFYFVLIHKTLTLTEAFFLFHMTVYRYCLFVYLSLTIQIISHLSVTNLQVYWIGPVLGALLAGVSHEFLFARSASRQKLVACLTCKDIDIVETASMTGSSLSTVTQSAMRAKQGNKQENNWGHRVTRSICTVTVM